ncbi:MFS transporter [Corynebacterium sp.]|uniref:MFS transporter n=1 Tax=Corynebacterium sp. TaxID=1720 RepID=UPI0026DC8FBD|nr:MFS transporter [Corynebacterium sp.]MDO5076695.1 MFS transporter [Corynebacterium sp.]
MVISRGLLGSPRFSHHARRGVVAMVAAGLASFNTLYATQALLPVLTRDLGIPPTQAALTVSATTGALALCIVPASILSERFGRGRILGISVVCAIAIGLALPWCPSVELLVAGRALQGVMLAGVPAVAMAWLSEEIHGENLAHAMGLYVAGTSLGGLLGRLIPSTVVGLTTWQWALLANSLVAAAFAATFLWLLPAQQNFRAKRLTFRSELQAMLGHWRNPQLAALFITGFLNMGTFVSLYNYLGYRMINDFGLSESLTGSLFLLFLSGTWSSSRAGRLVARFGAGHTLLGWILAGVVGLLLTLGNVWLTTAGLLIYTAAFFALHSTASGAIGRIAQTHRAEASSMYLCCYYCGSAAVGWASGIVFSHFN